ncbi:MAG TPA: hypothetical protein PKA27_02070 [Fimbriimonadaceae bacterium]|nr:hypothetical protein [Fimbriimonadaceae bacterium]
MKHEDCIHSAMLVMTTLSGQQGPTTRYAPVNGLNMYYEVHGSGEPVERE